MPLHWRERLHLLLVVVVLVWKSSAVLPWFGSIEKTANLQLHIRANQCHHICLPYPTLPFATYHVLFDFLSQLPFWEPYLCFLHGKKLSFLLISSISPGIQQRGTGGLSPGRSWSLLQGLCFPPDHSGIHGTGRWHHQWRWNRTDVPTKTVNVGQLYQQLHRPCDMIDVTCHRKMRFGSGFACRCFEGGDTKCEQSIFHEFFIKLSGGRSIYGPCFADEAFTRLHARANILSMANSGPNTKLWYWIPWIQSLRLLGGVLVPWSQCEWPIRQSLRNNSQFFILFGQAEFSIYGYL